MLDRVRVRFAPSPTGPLHIGGVRTALYNYLFAKKNHGDFILRIEDTDQARYVEGAEEYIIEALNWCGIPFDEGPGKEGDAGPYRQSKRNALYRSYAEKLIASGNAYYAFDTPEELEVHRKDHEERGKVFIYNWHNRLKLKNSLSLSKEEVQQKIKSGEPYVIRFLVPEDETLHFRDEIRGEITVETGVLDDKVLFKTDGMPTYHLANIVDDHLMKISHVIRGEEWLPSLALHVLLYRSFGWETPKFAHLPLILKPYGQGKLSKRDGDKFGFPVFPLEWTDPETKRVSTGYREEGYLPQAVVNMLAMLGWNQGGGTEKEIYQLPELIDAFSLEHVSRGGSKFDPEKKIWFQHHHMQLTPNEEIAVGLKKILEEQGLKFSTPYVQQVVGLLKERTSFLRDFLDIGGYFFRAPEKYDEKAVKKASKEDTAMLLQDLIAVLEGQAAFTPSAIREAVKAWIEGKNIGFGKVMQPFRIALVGAMQGPDVFEIASLLGKEESLRRLQRAKQIF